MRDRQLELGSTARLAGELGLTVATTRRMLRRGPPSTWGTAELEAFAAVLYQRAVASERQRRLNPAQQAVLERRRQQAALVYSVEARRAIVAVLESALRDLEDRRACAYGSWTPRAELARELGVSSVRLGRWLSRGRVPVVMMPAVGEWAQRRAEQALLRQARMQLVEDLIQRAKRPALAHGLPGAPKAQAARAPELIDREGIYQSAENIGYFWDRRVEEFATFGLIGKLEKWALSRRVPPKAQAKIGRAKFWIVTALVSIYDPPDSLASKDERRQRRRRSKSPGAFRQFERKVDKNQIGRDIMLGAAVSSRTVRRGGLERAVRLWLENMTIETCENELVFVHGLIIRNWRGRGEKERQRYIDAELARWEAQQRAADEKRERERDRVRQRARKKALGRLRSSRADASPSRRKRS